MLRYENRRASRELHESNYNSMKQSIIPQMLSVRQLLYILAVTCAISSCTNENREEEHLATARIEVVIDDEPMTGRQAMIHTCKSEISTNSCIGTEEELDAYENAIKTMTVFQFGQSPNGTYCLEKSYHFDMSGNRSPLISGIYGRNYRLYALLNTDDLSSSMAIGDSEEKLFGIRVSYNIAEASGTKGIPMVCGPVDVSIGSAITLHFMRLPARYDLRVIKDFSHGTFNVESLRLRQTPVETSPFGGPDAFADNQPSKVADGDHASGTDIVSLNAGAPVRFYCLENACGKLVSNPTKDPKLKVPQEGTGVNGYLPTYIEITGRYTDLSGGLLSENTYRMYLGENNYDSFDVIRGTRYTLTLTLTDEGGFLESYWKLDPIVTDNRTFRFSKREYRLEGNSGCIIGVTGNSPHYGITYMLDESLSGVSFNSEELKLFQGKEITQRSGKLTAYYWDGRIADRCTVTALAYNETADMAPVGIVNIVTGWDNQSVKSIHNPRCQRPHSSHDSNCKINHIAPWEDDYITPEMCPNKIEDIENCPEKVIVPSGSGAIWMTFQIAANYRVTSNDELVYDILNPGEDYTVESYRLLTMDGKEGDDDIRYGDIEYLGNMVKIGCLFQDSRRTHWHVEIKPTGKKSDTEERYFIVANAGTAPVGSDLKVNYGHTDIPHTYLPECKEQGARVWLLSDKTKVSFENTDVSSMKNSFVSGEEISATVNEGQYGKRTRVYAMDMNGNILNESVFNTDEYTCNVLCHGYSTDPVKASRIGFNFYTGFKESLMSVEVEQENVHLKATLNGRNYYFSTQDDSIFDFWSDGYTVNAMLFDQTRYDSYEWDATVRLRYVNADFLTIESDGSWTLQ